MVSATPQRTLDAVATQVRPAKQRRKPCDPRRGPEEGVAGDGGCAEVSGIVN